MTAASERKRGARFSDSDVARCYRYRPTYSAELYEFMLGRVPRRDRALDLGCGPGKICEVLARSFTAVDAVDPSPAMLQEAREGSAGMLSNICWQCAEAERAVLIGPYDLITAGASIHWMEPAILFPKLASCLRPDGHIAVIDGDDVGEAPWRESWRAFIQRWITRFGSQYGTDSYTSLMTEHKAWLEVEAEQAFVSEFRQPVRDFVECQHSRAIWARSALGDTLAREFGLELMELLLPHTIDGELCFQVETRLTWARPRTSPKSVR